MVITPLMTLSQQTAFGVYVHHAMGPQVFPEQNVLFKLFLAHGAFAFGVGKLLLKLGHILLTGVLDIVGDFVHGEQVSAQC